MYNILILHQKRELYFAALYLKQFTHTYKVVQRFIRGIFYQKTDREKDNPRVRGKKLMAIGTTTNLPQKFEKSCDTNVEKHL